VHVLRNFGDFLGPGRNATGTVVCDQMTTSVCKLIDERALKQLLVPYRIVGLLCALEVSIKRELHRPELIYTVVFSCLAASFSCSRAKAVRWPSCEFTGAQLMLPSFFISSCRIYTIPQSA